MRALDAQTLLPLLVANTLTQSLCVAGVNQLMSVRRRLSIRTLGAHSCTQRVSSVSTNIALTTRKALSLCFSVWWFGSGWNAQLGLGAGLVGIGTLAYAYASQGPPKPPAQVDGQERVKKEQ